jgi:hypothetical protein
MEISLTERDTYIPEWKGSAELPEGERITVDYKNLSYDQRKKHEHKEPPKIKISNAGGKSDKEIDDAVDAAFDYELSFDVDQDAILRDMDIKINNLESEDGPIDTWGKLLSAPDNPEVDLQGLITEIRGALLGSQKKQNLKN